MKNIGRRTRKEPQVRYQADLSAAISMVCTYLFEAPLNAILPYFKDWLSLGMIRSLILQGAIGICVLFRKNCRGSLRLDENQVTGPVTWGGHASASLSQHAFSLCLAQTHFVFRFSVPYSSFKPCHGGSPGTQWAGFHGTLRPCLAFISIFNGLPVSAADLSQNNT